MKLFFMLLFLTFFVSSEDSEKEKEANNNLKSIPLGQAFKERNAQHFKMEVIRLLNGSTTDFFKTINSLIEQGEDIFKLTGAAWAKKFSEREKIEEGRVYSPPEEME